MTTVTLETSLGKITLELDDTSTPVTTKNFLEYVNSGFYVNTIFHRVINGFMIQGGGLTSDMANKKNNPPIVNEANKGISNSIGTIAMARTSDPNSATSQFFINLADNKFLDYKSKTADGWGYCAFGKVIDGMDVVRKIAEVKTGNRAGHQDVPQEEILINSATVI
jgi:peptidyl-prolyl cis-trans isomerase B (cyclophilin B)